MVALALFPTIPMAPQKVLILQADNSLIHVKLGEDPVFLAAYRANGFHFDLRRQPSLSPDLNVVHLGFFNHMQSSPSWGQPIFSTPEAVITAVYQAWRDYPNGDDSYNL